MLWNALGTKKILQITMREYTYLLINIGTILIPLIYSFHPKLNFYKRWTAALSSITIVGTLFVCWDIYYTHLSVWGFNPDYLIGITIFNLPIEELLFFITIPYACLFTYHCFQKLIPQKKWVNPKYVSAIWSLILIIFGLFFIEKLYTSVTFISLAITLLTFQFITNENWIARIYLTLTALIMPFIIVNGILTGTGIESEVVWYNPKEIIGIRVLTIPIEDFCYGSLLIILNVFSLERLTKKSHIKSSVQQM